MRDPGRIDVFIEELRAFWKEHPDWRLGQIISVATPERFRQDCRTEEMSLGIADPFLVEDDELLDGIWRLHRRLRPMFVQIGWRTPCCRDGDHIFPMDRKQATMHSSLPHTWVTEPVYTLLPS